MFKITIEDVEKLKTALASANDLIMDAVFDFRPDGIELMAVDKASVCVEDLKIRAKAFEEYECEKPYQLCVNMQELFSCLKLFTGKTTIALSSNEAELILSQEKPSKKIDIRLLNIPEDYQRPPLEQMEFPNKFELKSDVLKSVVSEVQKFGDVLTFDISPNRIRFTAKGDVSKYEFSLTDFKSDLLSNIEITKPAISMIPREYLDKIVKSSPLSEKVFIGEGHEYPIKFDYKGEDISVLFIVAPRVEESLGKVIEEKKEEENEKSKIIKKTEKKTVLEA